MVVTYALEATHHLSRLVRIEWTLNKVGGNAYYLHIGNLRFGLISLVRGTGSFRDNQADVSIQNVKMTSVATFDKKNGLFAKVNSTESKSFAGFIILLRSQNATDRTTNSPSLSTSFCYQRFTKPCRLKLTTFKLTPPRLTSLPTMS